MRHLIVGHKGEVGGAHYRLLKAVYPETYGVDINEKDAPEDFKPDTLHVAIRHSPDFYAIVGAYLQSYNPKLLDILTTVPPGTTRGFGPRACHSTTRGQHPHLDLGLRAIPKHISGPMAETLARDFRRCGITCVTDPNPETTEVLHLLNNVHYGINLVFADIAYGATRSAGVDFMDWLNYVQTNNAGFTALGHESKVRPALTPPNGRLGGHCVKESARMLRDWLRTRGENVHPMIEMVASYA